MSTILVIVAVVFVVILVIKSVQVTEVTPGESADIVASVKRWLEPRGWSAVRNWTRASGLALRDYGVA